MFTRKQLEGVAREAGMKLQTLKIKPDRRAENVLVRFLRRRKQLREETRKAITRFGPRPRILYKLPKGNFCFKICV
jgi:hypothetical protein